MKVTLQNLTKEFPSRNKKIKSAVKAVDNFNFEFPDGSLIGLLGPSGCGKSTVLNLISGLLKPTTGKIFFGSEDVTDVPPEKRGIGLVFQSYALYPHLTVLKNILFPLENLKGKEKLSKDEMLKRATEVAKLVQIESLLDRKPTELSGGQQQRVAIARALVKTPSVLLLDEPLSNLDARLRLRTREEIKRIQRKTGVTTVFVTHDQDEAMSICDIIAVMQSGKIMQWGRPQEVYDNPSCLFVAKFLGIPPINVFDGEIKDGHLYIGNEIIFETPKISDRTVKVGIRPEGFIPSEKGVLTCDFCGTEVMGRDMSILSHNEHCVTSTLRAIVTSEQNTPVRSDKISFDLKPSKVFVFDGETEERIFLSPSSQSAKEA